MAEGEGAGAGRRKVFVSYSRKDIDFADQLVMALEDKGFDALLDRHDIDSGTPLLGGRCECSKAIQIGSLQLRFRRTVRTC